VYPNTTQSSPAVVAKPFDYLQSKYFTVCFLYLLRSARFAAAISVGLSAVTTLACPLFLAFRRAAYHQAWLGPFTLRLLLNAALHHEIEMHYQRAYRSSLEEYRNQADGFPSFVGAADIPG
jgi:hypothetical protein